MATCGICLKRTAILFSCWAAALTATAHAQPALEGPGVVPMPPAPQPIVAAPTRQAPAPTAPFSQLEPQPVTHKVTGAGDKLQLIVNTSRILTQDSRIPQAQVNNPDILGLQALSPNQIQIYGKRPGVTQVNIWDEAGTIHTIDVTVHGDVQELARLLHETFPKAALRVRPISTGVIISGYVDDPDQQNRIIQVAQNYFPQVINYVTVGGVQLVLLQVRVMEVSRTKLKNLGVDFAAVLASGSSFGSAASGILTANPLTAANAVTTNGAATLPFRIASGGDNFYGLIEALKQNNLAKVLADPNLVTESGRPAFMNSGGEIPIIVPQSLGTVSIEYRRYGTQVDFVPIVMGNGVIHLQVRPRVSELDPSRSVTINGAQVPALLVREFDVAVNMRAGETLAIGGLVQRRDSSSVRGIPVLMDTPGIGTFFRRTSVQENEIELLVMVTPQLVDGLDPAQVACLQMPGAHTTSPDQVQQYHQGHIEVPPDCYRPAHFDQGYLITPEGVAPMGGQGVPAGEMLPPATALPASPRPAPAAEPTPATESSLRIRSLPGVEAGETGETEQPGPATEDQSGFSEPAPRVTAVSRRQSVVSGGQAFTTGNYAPRATTSPTVRPSPSSEAANPGLLGPIGYDTTR
jgi:pilus assembly protein CpaC